MIEGEAKERRDDWNSRLFLFFPLYSPPALTSDDANNVKEEDRREGLEVNTDEWRAREERKGNKGREGIKETRRVVKKAPTCASSACSFLVLHG